MHVSGCIKCEMFMNVFSSGEVNLRQMPGGLLNPGLILKSLVEFFVSTRDDARR